MNYFQHFKIDQEEFIQEKIENEKTLVKQMYPIGEKMWECTQTCRVLYVIPKNEINTKLSWGDLFSARNYFVDTICISENNSFQIYVTRRLLKKKNELWPPWPTQMENRPFIQCQWSNDYFDAKTTFGNRSHGKNTKLDCMFIQK